MEIEDIRFKDLKYHQNRPLSELFTLPEGAETELANEQLDVTSVILDWPNRPANDPPNIMGMLGAGGSSDLYVIPTEGGGGGEPSQFYQEPSTHNMEFQSVVGPPQNFHTLTHGASMTSLLNDPSNHYA